MNMIIEKVNKAPTTYEIIDLANMFCFFFSPHILGLIFTLPDQ